MADSEVYDKKLRINQWKDKLMEHKKIFYSSELKMYDLELKLSNWDNTNKKRWSVRKREIPSPAHHEPPRAPRRPKEAEEETKSKAEPDDDDEAPNYENEPRIRKVIADSEAFMRQLDERIKERKMQIASLRAS